MTNKLTSALLLFYSGEGVDNRGRKLHEIIAKPDVWLERTHDYIQWLFPLPTASEFDPHAPTLTDEVRKAFTSSSSERRKSLQQNFSSAIYRMLVFYGYSFSALLPDMVSATGDWADKAANWLTDGNHNFFRMTRMLRSMTLLGREKLALSFEKALEGVARAHPDVISARTLKFWREAVNPASCF